MAEDIPVVAQCVLLLLFSVVKYFEGKIINSMRRPFSTVVRQLWLRQLQNFYMVFFNFLVTNASIFALDTEKIIQRITVFLKLYLLR